MRTNNLPHQTEDITTAVNYCQGLTNDEPVEEFLTDHTPTTPAIRPVWVGEVMIAVIGKNCTPHDTTRR